MRNAAKWSGTVALALVLGSWAAGQEPATEPSGHATATPASQPSDDIDPAQVGTIKAVIPDDFVTHKAAGGDFSIKSPASWKEAQRAGSVAMMLNADASGTSINVVVVPSPPGERLKAAMESLPKQLENQFKGFKLVKSDYVLYCGRPSGRISYEVEGANGKQLRITQIIVIRGAKDYVVTFVAPVEAYDDAYKSAEPVIASFDFSGPEPTSQPAQ